MKTGLARWLTEPWQDMVAGLERALSAGPGLWALAGALAAMLAAWWVYVPIHELMHAWGCLLAGGSVTRLEIDEAYGAVWLAQIFPYVVPGSEYAGRLSGFDTGGHDGIYLATVFFPYLLTLFPGVWLLKRSARAGRTAWLWLGAALPPALAPFMSLTGDYYELGSILVSRLAAGGYPDAPARWRADDVPLLVSRLWGDPGSTGLDALGVAASLVLGLALALATYALGAWLARAVLAGRAAP